MTALVFSLILGGLALGKIKCLHIRLGVAGVLCAALLCGALGSDLLHEDVHVTNTICSFLSSFGMCLFISVIGIRAGTCFWNMRNIKQWKALLSGVCVVLIGVVAIVMCLCAIPDVSKDMLLGVFAGSMTSTPALSAAQELCEGDSSVAIGYGMSYGTGVLFTVGLVQLMSRTSLPPISNMSPNTSGSGGKEQKIPEGLMWLSGIALLGILLAMWLPIGDTGCVLVSGLLVGAFCKRQRICIPALVVYKELGLIMFLIGAGIPAGMRLNGNMEWLYVLCGMFVSCLVVCLGYGMIRFLFRFSKSDALVVLSGGMTSTPALGVLPYGGEAEATALYSSAYLGALVTLLISVQGLFWWKGGV